MFNTMTITKIVGAVCGTLLVFLLGKWAAESLFMVGPDTGAEVAQAYEIETEDAAASAEPEPEIDFAEVMASADATAGEAIYRRCIACHKLDGTNGVGPHLDGVVDRDVASVDGYNYSNAMAAIEGGWTPEFLSEFLVNPRGVIPGTKMAFNGLPSVQDRANLVAYLQTQ